MTVILSGNFVLLIVLLFVNFILCIKRIPDDFPIINILVSAFSFVIGVAVFLPDSTIPANPYTTAFLELITLSQLIVSVMLTKVRK